MIRFDNVSKTYLRGQAPALQNLSIEFERGEFVFLVGASGSGKSTLMRLVLKETTPTRGSVYVAGKDLATIPSWRVPALRREIGMVFQDFRLLPSKTAYQNVEFALAVIGTPRRVVRRLVPEVLEMVGLEDKAKRLPHELSGGEQQRVAIARAYVNRPSILLADEPTGNLDPATAEGILELLAQINDRGTTVVMATHDRAAVDRMRRRVVEIVGGRVVRDDEHGTYESVDPQSVISGNAEDGEDAWAEVAIDPGEIHHDVEDEDLLEEGGHRVEDESTFGEEAFEEEDFFDEAEPGAEHTADDPREVRR
ncbi:cell division ATP-binding protein FtsE [Brachybacterium sp. EF45031]|uniref:cell division ATP-binding protein FtsE n=1 Tax=Brachybacterium sillae TaxID=2810536 RepID=UPI00217CE731|nr:cell division ATP-binding protein FtsE [Brachybacterium sillae]MCS6710983.1 cell division ATP-binding protein FtsE [Brachybacterium sillae]